MASVSMAASFLGGAATLSPAAASPRRLVITNSVKPNTVKVSGETKQEGSSNGRRDIIFAAAAAAISSVAGVAMAEPKRGTPEARKAYNPVCVANPTARICNN
ncbi:photosystem II 5 kDa protein, chloroplastic-like [Amaranthus tricolor]|uniref:photosystem II 5 kDa protein, chloroplastic-like n=1 Tax=Amaranthus tricolor TaxID=29722 RepID=UPI00258E99F7|nr:photosystem II 5 kDa protein, chloroplastic-like [Amaranthus tricolor]